MKIDGYVIIPPVFEWDDLDKVNPHASYRTFGTTPQESWMRHCGLQEKDMEFQAIVKRWFDRCWRLKEATLEIKYE
jgi:hypothetical protein